ncbi:MAG: hypothetical protein IK120_03795 [Muribaculaceae bacterium]|nr:hypothetical protein [Muribaculaceae bacterium]MBR5744841.1 hypothetical protein [Muribaculaceae bacterium]
MKTLNLFMALAIVLPMTAFGQNSKPASPTSEDIKVIAEMKGDLNNDGIDDVATICEYQNGKEHAPMLAITLSDGKGDAREPLVYNIFDEEAAENEYIIAQYWLDYTKTKCLKITVSNFATAGTWANPTSTYIYRYQNGDFYLIGESHDCYYRNSGEDTAVSINYLTNKKCETSSNVFDKNVKRKSTWSKIDKKPLRRLGDDKLTAE